MVFIGIDEKICLQKDLIIHTVYTVICVMMGDEIADAVDTRFIISCRTKELPCRRRPLKFLIFAAGAAVFFFGGMDTDVMEDGCRGKGFLHVVREAFQAADRVGIGIDLEEMLNAPGVAAVKGNGLRNEIWQ